MKHVGFMIVDGVFRPIFAPGENEMITYVHKDDKNGVRIRQYAKDKFPVWAVDFRLEPDLESARRVIKDHEYQVSLDSPD